jgi:hypothetical protein
LSRVIRISDTTYELLGKHAQAFETPDAVMFRILQNLKVPQRPQGTVLQPPGSVTAVSARSRGPNRSKRRLRTSAKGGELMVEFAGEKVRTWSLPQSQSDKAKIRAVRDDAWAYARSVGASDGQLRAIQKALSDAGYHLLR